MTIDEIYTTITSQKPAVIYVSGKTSTGKSTFGRKLRDTLGYQVIELEAVLLDVVEVNKLDERVTFRKVFFESSESEEKSLFLAVTDKIIADALATAQPLVIEGAIANAHTLQRVLQSAADLFFLYFHPQDIDVYIRNLTSRFMESGKQANAGLSSKFWQLIDNAEFEAFCATRQLTDGLKASIRTYALASQQESVARLKEYEQLFKGIVVIEIS